MRLPRVKNLIFCISLTIANGFYSYADSVDAVLRIEANTILQHTDRHRLIGTNLSLWSRKHIIENPRFQNDIRAWQPACIRIPGGSWSNEYFWNGNGVRIGDDHGPENFDAKQRLPHGSWDIDYREYKKGFRVHGEEHALSDYHGDLDVKLQHEWIQNIGSEAMVTVNVGSGSPRMAAEWVKWANQKQNYGVQYWEIGNELNGDWELGHRLPDGTTMTGELYAQRFLQFAAAMHSEDYSIKLGGPACSDLALDFVEELIRDGGEALDFVTLHAYPVGVNTKENEPKFAAINKMREAARQIHRWIETYQPQRKDQIEIGISEWNIKVNEDHDTVDLINGLWSAIWIGAMFEEGIDFANQWDLTTFAEDGGHSAFYIDETNGITIPKSQYWALWMWGNLMGDALVQSTIKGHSAVSSFVTRSEAGLQIMLVNTSESKEASVRIEAPGVAKSGLLHTFSGAEYFWDPHNRKPLWSLEPAQKKVDLTQHATLSLPKYSINVITLPWTKNPLTFSRPETQTDSIKPTLTFSLPERIPADRSIEGWIIAHDPDAKHPYLQASEPVQLSIEGPAKLSKTRLSLDNAKAAFTLTPTGPGKIQLRADSGNLSAKTKVELVPIQERALVYWTFDNPINQWNAKSTFKLGSESSIRPNQYVAAARLSRALPARNADLLFHFEPLPKEQLPFEHASGVVGKLRAAHNLQCADPKARVNLILQSDANHWIPIGSIPLSAIMGEWKTFAFTVKEPALLDAMAKLYAVRFQIQANAPVTGDIYLDDLGFIFRTGL